MPQKIRLFLGKSFCHRHVSHGTGYSRARHANHVTQVYLTVNYALQQFQIAPAVTQSAAALDLVPLVNPSSINCPSGPPGKAYIGVIVEGCVLAVVLIILIILGIYYLKGESQEHKSTRAERSSGPGQFTRKCAASNDCSSGAGCYGSVKMILFSYSNKDIKNEEGRS
jgi:hypothetical protein